MAMKKELEKSLECLECISECAEHQKTIVNDVLDLSKLEVPIISFRTLCNLTAILQANKIELNIHPFSAVDAIGSVKKMFESQASKKRITLDVVTPPDDIIIKVILYFSQVGTSNSNRYLQGDYARVVQILINLVSNAIKFTHTGGSLM